MRIVIIEDEEFTATDLVDTICQVEPDTQIVSVLGSVKAGIKFFKKNTETIDLIFSDIQLGDGLSFEIFDAVSISSPVVFCTAFNEYALQAFKANSIDYVLKPFSQKSIVNALGKYKSLKTSFLENNFNYSAIIDLFRKTNQKSNAILVYQKDKIFPIKFENIALFYIEKEITYLITLGNQKYTIKKTLDEVEKISPDNFYRANRQHLLNSEAIKDISQYFARKLAVSLKISYKEKIIISKGKSTDFLSWLSES